MNQQALETMTHDDFIAWLEAHHARVGVTPALREAYATYKANTRAATTLPPGAEGELVERVRAAGQYIKRLETKAVTPDATQLSVVEQAIHEAADLITTLSTTIEALKEERDQWEEWSGTSSVRAERLEGELEALESSLAEAQLRIAGLEGIVGRIVGCTHRPNPTDPHRIDVAPGKHREFQTEIEAARRALSET